MRLYKANDGWVVENDGNHFSLAKEHCENLTIREDLFEFLTGLIGTLSPRNPPSETELLPPIEHQEVWAAGVTYFRSRTARMEESQSAGAGDFYDRVYHAERPELFFKSTARRVVGTGQAVRIRRDSKWNVPEPELTLLVSPGGKILGFTAGNDMSSRDIEGENPLYLPQAKVYDGACGLGPAILVSPEELPPTTSISLLIRRNAEEVFRGAATIADMKRKPLELVEYLYRETSFPDGCFLLTGTGTVPPDNFTLASGDHVGITIEGIGTLWNYVA